MLLDGKINWKDYIRAVETKIAKKKIYCFLKKTFLIKPLLKVYTLRIPIYLYTSYPNIA